jgi:hypothetical protein
MTNRWGRTPWDFIRILLRAALVKASRRRDWIEAPNFSRHQAMTSRTRSRSSIAWTVVGSRFPTIAPRLKTSPVNPPLD